MKLDEETIAANLQVEMKLNVQLNFKVRLKSALNGVNQCSRLDVKIEFCAQTGLHTTSKFVCNPKLKICNDDKVSFNPDGESSLGND